MITAEQIRTVLPLKGDEVNKTRKLKEKLKRSLSNRNPPFLKIDEFDEIMHWKLRGQYNRTRHHRDKNDGDVIAKVTRCALSISHPNLNYELQLRTKILCSLDGVGVAVASAVLGLVFPDRYAVVDFRTWRQIFDKEKRIFSATEYMDYMIQIRRVAQELEIEPEEVDLAIWLYDQEVN